MDTKITKKRFNIHLEYDWVKYLILVIVAIFAWAMIYQSASSVPNRNRIDFFMYNTPGVPEQIEQRFRDDFPKIFGEETEVEDLNFENYVGGGRTDTNFGPVLTTRAMSGDFMIAPIEWYAQNPAQLDLYLDFDTVRSPYEDKSSGTMYDGYWTSGDGLRMYEYLDENDALYRFDREAYMTYFREEMRTQILATEEGKNLSEAQIAEKIKENEQKLLTENDGLFDKTLARYDGKIIGVLLNNVPGLENAFLFSYGDEYEGVGDDAKPTGKKTQYVLSIFGANFSKSDGGGNKGHFNSNATLHNRTEVFDLIEYLFLPNDEGVVPATKYAAL